MIIAITKATIIAALISSAVAVLVTYATARFFEKLRIKREIEERNMRLSSNNQGVARPAKQDVATSA